MQAVHDLCNHLKGGRCYIEQIKKILYLIRANLKSLVISLVFLFQTIATMATDHWHLSPSRLWLLIHGFGYIRIIMMKLYPGFQKGLCGTMMLPTGH